MRCEVCVRNVTAPCVRARLRAFLGGGGGGLCGRVKSRRGGVPSPPAGLPGGLWQLCLRRFERQRAPRGALCAELSGRRKGASLRFLAWLGPGLGFALLDCLVWALLGLVWFGLVWLGLAWLGLAWLGLAWLGLAWPNLAWLLVSRWVEGRSLQSASFRGTCRCGVRPS